MNFENIVIETLREVLDIQELTYLGELTAFDVPGWDSIANLKFLLELEKKLGIRFSPGDALRLKSLGDLVKLIEMKKSGGNGSL